MIKYIIKKNIENICLIFVMIPQILYLSYKLTDILNYNDDVFYLEILNNNICNISIYGLEIKDIDQKYFKIKNLYNAKNINYELNNIDEILLMFQL